MQIFLALTVRGLKGGIDVPTTNRTQLGPIATHLAFNLPNVYLTSWITSFPGNFVFRKTCSQSFLSLLYFKSVGFDWKVRVLATFWDHIQMHVAVCGHLSIASASKQTTHLKNKFSSCNAYYLLCALEDILYDSLHDEYFWNNNQLLDLIIMIFGKMKFS